MKRIIPILFVLLAIAGQGRAQSNEDLGQSRFVTTPDGVKIHCLEKGAGRSILFIPGWTMPAEIWESQIRYFARDHHVVAMDPRCQGESSQTTNGLTPAARARDIKAVVDQLKLKPAVLVGWSLGVTELAAYVDQFGTKTIASLVLVDGVAKTTLPRNMKPEEHPFLKSMRKDRQSFADQFVRSMYKRPQSDEYLNRIVAASLKTPTETAAALTIANLEADNRPALNKIDKPTLIVVSTVPKSDYSDMQKRIQGSRVEVFGGAGHALFVDEADRFNVLVSEFLKEIEKSGP